MLKDWDRPKLRRLFMTSDVFEILKLKISFRLPPEDIYWGLTRSGVFLVKSCYFLTKSVHFAGKQVASSSSDVSIVFNRIWNLSLPPKIKHFGWKLIKCVLPTASILFRRGWFQMVVVRCVEIQTKLISMRSFTVVALLRFGSKLSWELAKIKCLPVACSTGSNSV
ncbi:hypothetical protein M5689_025060 [Euphorbia peplus]|nr:hypothetical protein M5689_025060 [Euphorbia peplus]